MKYGLFTEIILSIVAVAIVYTYIRPEFIEIGEMQDNIAEFKEAVDQVRSVNNQLAALVTEMNDVPISDRRSLMTFMPDRLDDLSVTKDILTIANSVRGVEVENVVYSGFEEQNVSDVESDTPVLPVEHTFQLTVSGQYESIKALLVSLEENNYPLHVYNLSISRSNSEVVGFDQLSVTITLKAFSQSAPVEDVREIS